MQSEISYASSYRSANKLVTHLHYSTSVSHENNMRHQEHSQITGTVTLSYVDAQLNCPRVDWSEIGEMRVDPT